MDTKRCNKNLKNGKKLFLPGIEPGTLSVLDSHDNHYTTRTPQYNITFRDYKAKLLPNN